MSDNSLYVGITNNLSKRIKKHQNKKGSKFVYSRLPIMDVYVIDSFETRSEALKLESEIKKWTKDKKEELISHSLRYLIE